MPPSTPSTAPPPHAQVYLGKLRLFEDGEVLECQRCRRPFHLGCINLSGENSFIADSWECPGCAVVEGGGSCCPLEDDIRIEHLPNSVHKAKLKVQAHIPLLPVAVHTLPTFKEEKEPRRVTKDGRPLSASHIMLRPWIERDCFSSAWRKTMQCKEQNLSTVVERKADMSEDQTFCANIPLYLTDVLWLCLSTRVAQQLTPGGRQRDALIDRR